MNGTYTKQEIYETFDYLIAESIKLLTSKQENEVIPLTVEVLKPILETVPDTEKKSIIKDYMKYAGDTAKAKFYTFAIKAAIGVSLSNKELKTVLYASLKSDPDPSVLLKHFGASTAAKHTF